MTINPQTLKTGYKLAKTAWEIGNAVVAVVTIVIAKRKNKEKTA